MANNKRIIDLPELANPFTGDYYIISRSGISYKVAVGNVIGISGNFITANQTGVLSGQFYPLTSNPQGYLTDHENSRLISWTGAAQQFHGAGLIEMDSSFIYFVNRSIEFFDDNSFITNYPNSIEGWNFRVANAGSGKDDNTVIRFAEFFTGHFIYNELLPSGSVFLNTGQIAKMPLFYPLNSNPSGYLTSAGTTGSLINVFYPLIGNPSGFITTGQTGSFGGGSTPTGVLTGVFYPLGTNPSGFVTNTQTGNFITTSQTGNFVSTFQSGLLTGIFYPLKNNPSGFITSSQTGNFVTTNQTGNFITAFTSSGVLKMSVNGGGNIFNDHYSATPQAEGQLGISYGGNKKVGLWTSRSATKGDWNGSFTFNDVCDFGSQTGMDVNNQGAVYHFYNLGSTGLGGTGFSSINGTMTLQTANPYTYGGLTIGYWATGANGIPVQVDDTCFTISMNGSNISNIPQLVSELGGWGSLTMNNPHGLAISLTNNQIVSFDMPNRKTHFAFFQNGIYSPVNTGWLDSFLVDHATQIAYAPVQFAVGTGVIGADTSRLLVAANGSDLAINLPAVRVKGTSPGWGPTLFLDASVAGARSFGLTSTSTSDPRGINHLIIWDYNRNQYVFDLDQRGNLALGNLGSSTGSASFSALLDLQSDPNTNTRGFLPPRLTQVGKNALVSPATGLIFYQLDSGSGLSVYDGVKWNSLITSAQTGSLVNTTQTGNFISVGQTGGFVSTAQTGNFITNANTGNFLVKANNLSDITNLKSGCNNVAILQMSPLGGNNGINDITGATALFEGQLGTAYDATKNTFLYFAGSTVKGDWLHNINFLGGIATVGDSTQMNATSPTPKMIVNVNGGKSGWGNAGDSSITVRNWSSNNNNSGPAFTLSVMSGGIGNTGIPTIIDDVGVSFAHVPSNRISGLIPGNAMLVFNTNANLKGLSVACTSIPGGFGAGNYSYVYYDFVNAKFRIPKWVNNTFQPSDNGWKDTFLVDSTNGNITLGVTGVSGIIDSAAGNTILIQGSNFNTAHGTAVNFDSNFTIDVNQNVNITNIFNSGTANFGRFIVRQPGTLQSAQLTVGTAGGGHGFWTSSTGLDLGIISCGVNAANFTDGGFGFQHGFGAYAHTPIFTGNSTFVAHDINVADFLSNTNSSIFRGRINGSTKFFIDKTGNVIATGEIASFGQVTASGNRVVTFADTNVLVTKFTSPLFTLNSGFWSAQHGLSSTPKLNTVLICQTNDAGSAYLVGDEVDVSSITSTSGGLFSFGANTTGLFVSARVIPSGNESNFKLINRTGLSFVSPTAFSNFKLKIYATL